MKDIVRYMLGHSNSGVELVIITPLKSTYERLKETLDVIEKYETTFFENCLFHIEKGNKRGVIVLSPQGIAAKDVIELFNNTNILFFGLAGSLNTRIKIGNFVEVQTVYDGEKNDIMLYTTGKYKTVKCGYSPCMLGTIAKDYCDFARVKECDVVDMETVYCAKTAIERNNKLTSLLLVTDIPGIVDFWQISEQKKKKIKECRQEAINKIIDYIKILI